MKIPGLDHPITVEPAGERVTVRVEGRVVADTTAALRLQEASYPPVYYVPIEDVDETVLERSSTSTYCPFKGNASYYRIVTGDTAVDDAIWTYERPYSAVAEIAGHVAFYPDRVELSAEAA
jgi:uncharacterized protein (DUF427 family)